MFEPFELNAQLSATKLVVLLLPFLVAAVITDLSSRRIPNVLIALMLLSGFLAQISATASAGESLLAWLGGAGVGLLILLPFHLLGGMGAGDVKLLAAAGSFLGPQGAFLAGVSTLGVGAILGLFVLAYRYLEAYRLPRRLPTVPSQSGQTCATAQLPYSLAISAGTLIAVIQW